MKKMLQFLFTLMVMTATVQAQGVGDTFTLDDINYTVTSLIPNEAEVSGSTLTALDIPMEALDANTSTTYTITAIGASAFASSSVETVILPSTVATLKLDAFINSTSLTSINTENVVTILKAGLRGCSAIESLDLSSLKTVVANGLSRMPLIKSLSLPVIETIANYSFVFNDGMTSLNIGASLSSMGEHAFTGLIAITSVQVNTDTPVVIDDQLFDLLTVPANITLYVPTAAGVTAYQGATGTGWEDLGNYVVGQLPVLSTNNIEKELGLSIYPNPTNGIVSIARKELNDATNVTVYDINGRALLSNALNDTLSEINISNLASGLYIFKIESGNKSFSKRVIKQ